MFGDALANARYQGILSAGASYVIGSLKLMTNYSNVDFSSATGSGDLHFQNFEVHGRYQITPAISVAGAYTYTDSRIEGEKPKFHQFSLQTAYALSKRTDVYLQGEYQHMTDQEGLPVGAVINGVGMSSNGNQVSATIGMRHRF